MPDLISRLIGSALMGAALLPFVATDILAQSGTPLEPLGQSSRRTSLVISEIMYNPLDRADGRNLEFIEFFNSLSTPEDISGWRLDGDADFTFPANTVVPGRGFLVVATAPADVQAVHGISGVLGPFSNTNSLPNTRGTVRLRNRIGAVFLEARYDTDAPWPIGSDGAGHSLVLARPSYGEGKVEAWAASDAVGGSPGQMEPVTADPLRHVVINEFLAHTDDPDLDFIELYNHSNQTLDISGCYLSDARETNKFIIPPGTVLAPRGFVSFDQSQLGFSLSSGGERIYFRNAANTRVLDAVHFEAQANGVSSGRSPDGAPGFSELASMTPGAANSAPLLRDLVINEIMYNPISGNSDDEFIELYNRGASAVNVGGWRLAGGIGFRFPGNIVIPANGYLVIARDAARLISRYPGLNAGNTVGDFSGALGNGGERIALAMPDPFLTTNGIIVSTNFNYIVVDEVTYRDGGRWGRWSDGGGSSLELIDARSDNRLAANWADSDETAKAPWTTVSVRGVLDNGTSPADQLQVLLQGPGECLIDNVEVLTSTGVNVVANSTFEGGATGWTAEGTQGQSGPESAEGFNSSRSYHVRATDRGDNQVNRIRTPLTAVQSANVTDTIRANVRWLRGHPEILFRLRGNWLEAAVSMNLPTNLGTPGAANSRAVPNAAPAIYDVMHHPPVPAANTPVVVTARLHDTDGISSVELRYRIDPGATLSPVPMVDNGTGGDAVAGDGLYSATIPGQVANTLVAFRVVAMDGFLPGATATFPQDAPTRECLVRFGETVATGTFPSYRIWMTQATFNTWDARNNLNNTMNDVTFVAGNHRVIYNVGAVYAGSPYIAPGFNTPTGNRCGYSLDVPPDDPFLGNAALQIDWPGGHGNENTAIQEQMAYWIADQMDLAFSHRYFIRWTVNGVTDMQRGGVFESVMQPGADFLEQWSPGDSDGDFFRIDRAFEFDDNGGRIADPEPQLRVYTTPDLVNGGTKKKTEKYRWYWLKRAFDSANDYTNVFVLADALNSPGPEPYTSQTEGLIDVEQWMGIFAAEHIINNFDSWGHDIGKNMYMFCPENGRAQLYMFDLDWLMLVAAGSYPANPGPGSTQLFVCDDPTITRMYSHPPFRRAYFRAVQDAVDRAFVQSKYEAVMDAKYNSLVANGITLCDGQALAAPTAVKTWFSQRRTFLTSQLAGVSSPFTISNASGFTTLTNLATVSGAAPITVKTIEINGVAWPLTWTSVTNWLIRLPVTEATNELAVVGYDRRGNPVAGASNVVTVVFEGAAAEAPGAVVINEIMYNPALPGAEYVELFNASTNSAFDLGGWRFNGLDYTFPEGSWIGPGRFLVLVKDRAMASAAYGIIADVFDEFEGSLQGNGETLTLFKPSGTNTLEVAIDKVRYENVLPWGTNASGTGPSLQLIDVSQDNGRVSNWESGVGWRKVSRTGNILNGTNLLVWLATAGSCYIDDVSLVGPGGTNILVNGSFETGSNDPWIVGSTYADSVVVSGISHSGANSFLVRGSGSGGAFPNGLIQQVIANAVQASSVYTLTMHVLYHTNPVTVNLRTLPGNNLPTNVVSMPVVASPGAVNLFAADLPSYDPLWLNEVQPGNSDGPTDNLGERDPWIELFNSSTQPIDLEGYFLADNFDTNLLSWPFPAGAVIAPGEFKLVWADGQPTQTSGTHLHTSFRLPGGTGSVALVRLAGGKPQITDYLSYSGLGTGRSFGAFPDGQPVDRQEFHYVSAGRTNNGTPAPLVVFINEWMAANTSAGGLADPADGDFDDWFELYNPGANPVNLGGYFLTDNLTNKFQFEIPAGYMIPAGGFLLVWADNETGQNSIGSADLHVNFSLRAAGEAVGLFAPDGTPIDAVTFTNQTDNVSQGRNPDGSPSIVSLPAPSPRGANVTTSPAPTLVSVRVEGAVVTLNFTTLTGRAYRLQFKDDLGAPTWNDLPGDVIATGPLSSKSDTNNGVQRFYQVQVLP